MQTEFDPGKDAINQQKHGVSLALANQIDWFEAVCFVDDRNDYDEVREIGLVVIEQRLYVVVFVQRGEDTMRIISLRKATKREVKHYEQSIQH